MLCKTSFLGIAVLILQHTTAQISTTGNPALPACGLTCAQSPSPLQQAIAACGGETTSNQQTWICFCQSNYLKTLPTTPVGICDAFCTDPAQNQLISTWYTANCGQDLGASEHPEQAIASSVAAAATATTAVAGVAATNTGTMIAASTTTGKPASTGIVLSNGNGMADVAPNDGTPTQAGGWWSNHWKWIVMLLVILIGMVFVTWLLIWLKRRHDRRRDAAPSAFNEGITMRSTPMMSAAPAVGMEPSSGRDSPARTRDAFMPYGYNYARSESKLGSRTNIHDSHIPRGSPLASAAIFPHDEKDTATPAGKKKRIYVRERSMTDIDYLEKR